MPGASQRAVSDGIVRTLQNDDTLFILTGGRIQRAEDPTTRDLTLPAIVFQFIPGRTHFPLLEYYIYNIQFLCFSSKSYEECEELHEAMNAALNYKKVAQNNVNFIIYPVQAPSENFIPEEGNYVLSTFWIARAIEP